MCIIKNLYGTNKWTVYTLSKLIQIAKSASLSINSWQSSIESHRDEKSGSYACFLLIYMYMMRYASAIGELTHACVSCKTCMGKACRSISLVVRTHSVQSHLSRFYFILSAFCAYAIRKYFFCCNTHRTSSARTLTAGCPDVFSFRMSDF